MTLLRAKDHCFDVDGVVFDKDGTLLDFNHLWGPRTMRWLDALVAETGDAALAPLLARAIGFDPERQAVTADSPLAVASLNDLYAVVGSVLFQHGLGWHRARTLAAQTAEMTLAAGVRIDELQPLGQVAETVQRLTAAGIKVAIATSDDRALTEVMLDQMGIARGLSAIVCADDGLPAKPDPAVLRWIATELGTTPDRLLMVGDTVNDILTGRNAGAAGCIGIRNGGGSPEALAEVADVVLDSVDELVVGSG